MKRDVAFDRWKPKVQPPLRKPATQFIQRVAVVHIIRNESALSRVAPAAFLSK
jgi:hypothetical protein